jgi:putative YphP/YqiW family bacilliredoxin
MYPEHLTTPMEKDLTDYGFQALKSSDDVATMLDKKDGTTLVVVNSVCGCAAGNCRPGVKAAAQNAKTPDNMVTVFAGVDKDAVNAARGYMLPYPPSSPSIALFKDGQLVHFLERHHIEGNSADTIAANLKMAFDKFC